MNMDTPPRPALRADLAHRPLPPLRPGRQGTEGPRADVARTARTARGPSYRTICRSLAVDPDDGAVYFSTGDGDILRYDYDRDAMETVAGREPEEGLFRPLRSDLPRPHGLQLAASRLASDRKGGLRRPRQFGLSVPLRSAAPRASRCWSGSPRCPRNGAACTTSSATAISASRSGPDGRTLYYLTGGPIYVDGRRLTGKDSTAKGEAKGLEDLHLVTYDIPTAQYIDHGAIFMKDGQRPLYVNSIAVGKDGSVYTLCRITADGHTRTDLIRIPSESDRSASALQSHMRGANRPKRPLTNPLAIRI